MFICTSCHAQSLKWTGKCPSCDAWNTLEESIAPKAQKGKVKWGSVLIGKKIESNHNLLSLRYKSESGELDAVLGGWLSSGSLILLSGEPGIGKSTLALQMAEWYTSGVAAYDSMSAESAHAAIDGWLKVLYISWEENIGQISQRAIRLWVKNDNIEIITENYFDDVVSTIKVHPAHIIIIDSLSVMGSDTLDGTSGSISQIRTMTEVFMSLAKTTGKSIILIGHVTKDWSIGGPKALEHLVDVVLFLEGVRTENYRILRALKNRFWSTDAVGLFRMEQSGLVDIPNPGLEFIDTNTSKLPWSALTLTLEWNRPLLIEIEALTTYTKFGYPKRSSRGIPQAKLELLIAVMTKFTDTKLESYDVYTNIGRWFSLTEPGVDLACVAALMSSKSNTSLGDTLYLGEVSLTGVVKTVFLLEKRIIEAAKLWFERMVIPAQYAGPIPKNISPTRISHIKELHI